MAKCGIWYWETTPPDRETRTYRLSLPTSGVLQNCPVLGCLVWAALRTVMWVNLFHRHVRDNVII